MTFEPSRQDAEKLISEAVASGIDNVELVRRLLLIERLSEWYQQRSAGSGSQRIKHVEANSFGISIHTWDEDHYEFRGHSNSRRWYRNGWISRSEIERNLGVWPGYLDAIEDFVGHFVRLTQDLKSAHEQDKERTHQAYLKLSEELRNRVANDRHPELRLWRERNPVCSPIPQALKHIRNIKRVEVLEPCHVYFLLHEGTVVYVGQTSAAWPNRILQHLKDRQKKFDDVWFLEVDRPSLTTVERKFINEFKPRYNGGKSSLDEGNSSNVSAA